jgi:O-antigen ligase
MDETSARGVIRSVGTVLAVLVPLFVFLLFLNPGWLGVFGVLVLVLLVPLFMMDDARALVLIIVLRPLLDVASNTVVLTIRAVPLNLSSIVSICVVLWGIRCLLHSRTHVFRVPFLWLLAALLAIGVVGFSFTLSPDATLREVVRLASILAIFAAAYVITREQKHHRMLRYAFAWSLVMPLIFAMLQFITGSGLDVGGISNRIFGTFGHPNVLGFYLVVTLGFLLGTMPRAAMKRPRVLAGLAAAVAALLFTYTRGAWLGFAIVLAVIGVFRRPLLAIGVVVAVLLFAFGYPAIQRTVLDVTTFDLNRIPVIARVLDRNAEESSLDWRAAIWENMRQKVMERPLVGHGLGVFPIVRQYQVSGYDVGVEAHNDYLRLAVETGFLGLGLYLLLLTTLIITTFRRAWRLRQTPDGTYAASIAGVSAALAFMSYYDNLLQATSVMWAFWIVLAAYLSNADAPRREPLGDAQDSKQQ